MSYRILVSLEWRSLSVRSALILPDWEDTNVGEHCKPLINDSEYSRVSSPIAGTENSAEQIVRKSLHCHSK